jgi:acyl carrier protein
VLLQQTPERLRAVLRGKAHGAHVLDALTRDRALDFFVLYSAAGTLLGPAGQVAYAAANAQLDAIAHARRAAGRPALSVDWGQWREGGMASQMRAGGHDVWSERGLGWITPAQGFARLERLLREGAVQTAVLPIDWARFVARLPAGADAAFFADVAGRSSATATGPAATAPAVARAAQWRALPASQRKGVVQEHLAEQTRAMLGVAATTHIDAATPLKELGLDSLMAVELRNALARSIGESLPATLLFDHPSLAALTRYLMTQLKLVDDTPALSVAPTAAQQQVAELSDAEAEAQLLAELASLDAGGSR